MRTVNCSTPSNSSVAKKMLLITSLAAITPVSFETPFIIIIAVVVVVFICKIRLICFVLGRFCTRASIENSLYSVIY